MKQLGLHGAEFPGIDNIVEPFKSFLRSALRALSADPAIIGIGLGGSWVPNPEESGQGEPESDEYSNLNLVIVTDRACSVLSLRSIRTLAEGCAPLLTSYSTAPNFLRCLFLCPPIRVDVNVLTLDEFRSRFEDPRILWERGRGLTEVLLQTAPDMKRGSYRQPVPGLTPGAFWLWTHYATAKLNRGEIFQVLHRIDLIRDKILAPCLAVERARRASGTRRFESRFPQSVERLRQTVAVYDHGSCMRAIREAIGIHNEANPASDATSSVELAILNYLEHGGQASHTDSHPAHIRTFLDSALPVLRRDSAVLGIAATGSWTGANPATVTPALDDHSDLDLQIVGDQSLTSDMPRQINIARSIAPPLLILRMRSHWLACIYRTPLLRVDLTFATLQTFERRFQNPAILWQRDSSLSAALESAPPDPALNYWPQPTMQWIEERFWYAISEMDARLSRGEVFHVMNLLSCMREELLAPLIAIANNSAIRGLRLFEQRFPTWILPLQATVPIYDPASCRSALNASVSLFRRLRSCYTAKIDE